MKSFSHMISMKLFFLFVIPSFGFSQENAPVAQNIVSIGDVKAVNGQNQTRVIKRSDSVFVKDTIDVGAASKAQFKFTDGGLINLIASTQYRIDSYVFQQPNQASQYASTLITGGFRAISGTIGRENPTKTTVATPVAVMGMRGTTYEALYQNETLFAGCEEGTVSVSNELGELLIGPTSPSRYAIVRKGQKPLPLVEKPAELNISFDVEEITPPQETAPSTSQESAPSYESQTSPEEIVNYQENIPTQESNQFATPICPGEGEGLGEGAGAGAGTGYAESSYASYISPAVALGTLSIAGVIAIVSQLTHHHHSSSSITSCSIHSH